MSDDPGSDIDEDFPSIGDRRAGRILVCMGDDRPDQLIDWLDALVNDFEELKTIADEHVVKVNAGSQGGVMNDWSDFCSALGVHIDSNFWEGSMISGHFQMGWIQPGQIRRAKKIGKEILKAIRRDVLEQIRNAAISEIKKIKDLDRLIDRVCSDRASLLGQIEELKRSLATSHEANFGFERAAAETRLNDVSALSLNCLRLACAVMNHDRRILLAGPLVLWEDGIVYALTSRGSTPLPDDSPPAVLLNELRRSGHLVVEVGERTLLGRSPLSGNCYYREGAAHISGWNDVVREVDGGRRRSFTAVDPVHLPTVFAIHEHFKNPQLALHTVDD